MRPVRAQAFVGRGVLALEGLGSRKKPLEEQRGMLPVVQQPGEASAGRPAPGNSRDDADKILEYVFEISS